VARAARRADPCVTIRAVDEDPATLEYALREGVADEALPASEAAEAGWFGPGAADLVVLATPVEVTIRLLADLGRHGYDGIATDVASTKSAVVAAADHAAEDGARYRFVGGHPMAGSERSGVEASTPTLFDGAYYVLTPSGATDMAAFKVVHEFVTRLGARVISIDARDHDEAVAVVSHVPHITAAALVELASSRAAEVGADLLRLGAGGFKDMTRIAAGSPDLWTGICMDNAAALSAGIKRLSDVLQGFKRTLDARDADGVRAWLTASAEVRRSLPAQWVPATSRLRELTVPVSDRPGVVGIVTTAVSRAGCNIEDIEIDHRSEDSALLRLVLTDEGDTEALMDELRDRGFEPSITPLEEAQG